MRIARWIFWLAGLYGLAVLVPQYFLFEQIGRDLPPPITHPEYYFGFIGVAISWQLTFLVIGHNPLRFRALMPVALIEKLSFAIPVAALFVQQRVAPSTFAFGMIDLLWGVMFGVAWCLTSRRTVSVGL